MPGGRARSIFPLVRRLPLGEHRIGERALIPVVPSETPTPDVGSRWPFFARAPDRRSRCACARLAPCPPAPSPLRAPPGRPASRRPLPARPSDLGRRGLIDRSFRLFARNPRTSPYERTYAPLGADAEHHAEHHPARSAHRQTNLSFDARADRSQPRLDHLAQADQERSPSRLFIRHTTSDFQAAAQPLRAPAKPLGKCCVVVSGKAFAKAEALLVFGPATCRRRRQMASALPRPPSP